MYPPENNLVETANGTNQAAEASLRAGEGSASEASTLRQTFARRSPPDSSNANVPQILPVTAANDTAHQDEAGVGGATDIDNHDLSPRASSPLDDEKLESSTDLQFKKKDFRKSRAQLFQLVLLTASLKSLKQQYTQGNPPPLLRNHSTVGTANSKNFQLFIQAPVLSSVTNLRSADEVEIGQQLPFDHRTEAASVFPDLSKIADSNDISPQDEQHVDDDDDDIYKEETTLQQQRLTINALKKLSLSLAPIIRLDDDDTDLQPRQLTTKLLNGRVAPDQRLKLKPYQPAKVDLSSFSSLTRQRGFFDLERGRDGAQSQGQSRTDAQRLPQGPIESQSQNQLLLQNPDSGQLNSQASVSHSQGSSLTNPTLGAAQSFGLGYNSNPSSNIINNTNMGLRSTSNEISSQDRGRGTKQDTRATHTPSHSTSKAIPVNGFKPFGNIEHTIGGRNSPGYPVVPPHDMNIRNRKVSIQHEPQPLPVKHSLLDKKLQQIKGFRSPGYVPAVLRRTDENDLDVAPVSSNGLDPDSADNRPSLLSIVLQPRETGSSVDSVRSSDLVYSNDSIQPGALKTGPYTLDKRQYEYILRAAPTRKHWLKDESVAECGFHACHKHFNFFERRHHCRKCGGIFCKDHTSHYLYINHLAQFTTGGRGTLSRVCDNCIEEYNEFMKSEFGVGYETPRSRQQSPPSVSQGGDFRREIFKPKTQKVPLAQLALLPISPVGKLESNEQVVGSVPANWSWLSF